jgi:hypothetical protein
MIRSMLNAAMVEEVPAPTENTAYALRPGDAGGMLVLRAIGSVAGCSAATTEVQVGETVLTVRHRLHPRGLPTLDCRLGDVTLNVIKAARPPQARYPAPIIKRSGTLSPSTLQSQPMCLCCRQRLLIASRSPDFGCKRPARHLPRPNAGAGECRPTASGRPRR